MTRTPWLLLAALFALFVPSACAPRSPEAVAVVKKNLTALNADDLEAARATIHPESPIYKNVDQVMAQLAQYDLVFELEQADVVSASPGEVRIAFRQTTRDRSEWSDFRNNRVTGSHILRRDGDTWKIWATTVTRVEYLEE